jgi:predicted ATPase
LTDIRCGPRRELRFSLANPASPRSPLAAGLRLLNGLDRRQAAALVKEAAANHYLPQEVVDRIIANSDGVPLFIEELTRSVLERASGEKNNLNHLPEDQFTFGIVPTSLHDSLMGRLDRLPAGKEITQTASVIGREFSFEMLQTICEETPVQIERSLKELVDAQLIIPHGRPPEAVYLFKHALVQEAAYTKRTWGDVRLESAFRGRAEVRFRACQVSF